MEIQQSNLYAEYIKKLRWTPLVIDGIYIFTRWFPIIGGIAKIHRPARLPQPEKIIPILRRHHVRILSCEPISEMEPYVYLQWIKKMKKYFFINTSPFLPTKTNVIPLSCSEEHLFASFSQAKRRAVRKAIKNNVLITQSTNIHDVISVKNKSGGIFGFLTTTGIDALWKIYNPQHAAILLASHKEKPERYIGGVLLLFWKKRAYYWIAGATRYGKKLSAPTLLVWESIKLAKIRKCTLFDFVGVYDERIPAISKDWKGFTKFKEGFGGKDIYYPVYIP